MYETTMEAKQEMPKKAPVTTIIDDELSHLPHVQLPCFTPRPALPLPFTGPCLVRFSPSPMNHSTVSTFVILGLSNCPEMRPLLFSIFLCVYLVAVLGNSFIVAAVSLSAALHKPMYFLLLAQVLMDVVCTSFIVPKLLETTLTPQKTIIYGGCMVQLFYTWSLESKMVLFIAVAYGRYVAICFPLSYITIMSRRTCSALLADVLLFAVTDVWVHTGLILRLNFCGTDAVTHFFCKISALLAISSSPVQANEVMVFMADIALAMGDFLLTCLSYSVIVAAILRIQTAEGIRKDVPIIYTYICPASSYSFERDKVVAVTLTLNPIVTASRTERSRQASGRIASHGGHEPRLTRGMRVQEGQTWLRAPPQSMMRVLVRYVVVKAIRKEYHSQEGRSLPEIFGYTWLRAMP
ncbi:olfactory receptor 13G1-like [Tachyglossus aculeatus]|uniref:olfactory receptor 13G1-like n=1 Tax=Tachyglossus aculeatus TaxID=9261 RepID=UPI0018F68B40|nr:olfactory receptor 13G1-like [Tachyglossus aculeatus]